MLESIRYKIITKCILQYENVEIWTDKSNKRKGLICKNTYKNL